MKKKQNVKAPELLLRNDNDFLKEENSKLENKLKIISRVSVALFLLSILNLVVLILK